LEAIEVKQEMNFLYDRAVDLLSCPTADSGGNFDYLFLQPVVC
jgi:hypothetical protein